MCILFLKASLQFHRLKSLSDNAKFFVGHGPGTAGIFDFSRDIKRAE